MNIGHKLQASEPDQIEVGEAVTGPPTGSATCLHPPSPQTTHLRCPSQQCNQSLRVHLLREKVVMMQAVWGEVLLKVASLEGSREEGLKRVFGKESQRQELGIQELR